jgi:orotate phosphoribosyltransferase
VHLRLASGKHSNGYVNCDPITPHPGQVDLFAQAMLERIPVAELDPKRPITVIGPEKGVNAFLYSLAFKLYQPQSRPQIYSIVVEKRKGPDGNEYYVDRDGHASLCEGAQLVGVEDVSTTGGSLGGALKVGVANGGIPTCGTCIWNRGGVTAEDLGLPPGSFRGIITHPLPMWAADSCPLCEALVPMALDLGHGEKFQAENPDYAGGWNHLLAA